MARLIESVKGSDEDQIKEIELINKNKIRVKIIDLGAIITGIYTPNRDNEFENIVLNYEDHRDYKANPPYLGAIIGRVAGRLEGALLKVENKNYFLDNNKGCTLHGGSSDFSKKIWKIRDYNKDEDLDEDFVILSCESPDMEAGFPGDIEVFLKYSLSQDNKLTMEINASSSKLTYLNTTNHTYFNLNKKRGSILEHKLKIESDWYAPLDDNSIPSEGWKSTAETIFDLRKSTKIKTVLDFDDIQIKKARGIDHPFKINDDITRPIVELVDESSGRRLKIYSNQDALVVYSGNYLDEDPLNRGFKRHDGICFEFQQVPNAPNSKFFKAKYTKPGSIYNQKIIYEFDLVK